LRTARRLYNDLPVARNMRRLNSMSLGFMIAACAFALVLGCAVACVDWWREARLAPRLRVVARAQGGTKPVRSSAQRRAA
jgi:hypothetical protein